MKAAKKDGRPAKASFALSARNAWIGFVDLIKVDKFSNVRQTRLLIIKYRMRSLSTS